MKVAAWHLLSSDHTVRHHQTRGGDQNQGAAMTASEGYYPLPQDIVTAVRHADVLTGEFLRPVPEQHIEKLKEIGLAAPDMPSLNARGMAVRSWLMRGTADAPRQVARLLNS